MDAKKAVRKHEQNSDMLKYGRNMAKVMNQRSPGRKGA
jgi:hypothetical protein